MMTGLRIREAAADDAEVCGRVFFDAFEALATRHAFPIEPGSPDFTDFKMRVMLSSEGTFGLVAERDGDIVGSAFQDERGVIVGVGPVSVDPHAGDGVGRALMEALLRRSRDREVVGVRLVQTAYNYRSLSLYAKLGFVVREPLSVFQGSTGGLAPAGATVRPAVSADADACDRLCRRVHGHDRHAEVQGAIDGGMATIVERDGAITGYTTGLGYIGHAVGRTDDDVIALLASAEKFTGLGVLVPSRNTALMRWCLDTGLQLVQQSTLMTIGLYNEPHGSWLPSIGY
jgi:GNAT superfamily N-acetyltransferase